MIRRSPLLLVWAFVPVLALAACERVTGLESAPLGEPFWLDYGESVRLPAAPGSIRFVELLEDSRCPSGPLVQCVSGGRVRIRLAIAPPAADEGFHELRLLDQPTAVNIGGYLIQLRAVEPPPAIDAPPVTSYRVQLIVTAVR